MHRLCKGGSGRSVGRTPCSSLRARSPAHSLAWRVGAVFPDHPNPEAREVLRILLCNKMVKKRLFEHALRMFSSSGSGGLITAHRLRSRTALFLRLCLSSFFAPGPGKYHMCRSSSGLSDDPRRESHCRSLILCSRVVSLRK